MITPIKRNESLQPLSREHHQGLLLCWKIRKGISGDANPVRIKKYIDWFYREHLVPHFELEEKYIFPILGESHQSVALAVAEHRTLEKLVNGSMNSYTELEEFASALESHIRFEERILFNEIQEAATPEQLKFIDTVHHEEAFHDNTEDVFWV
jgi:iron-sulfur cluster repair protein YtfE (RIC family)